MRTLTNHFRTNTELPAKDKPTQPESNTNFLREANSHFSTKGTRIRLSHELITGGPSYISAGKGITNYKFFNKGRNLFTAILRNKQTLAGL